MSKSVTSKKIDTKTPKTDQENASSVISPNTTFVVTVAWSEAKVAYQKALAQVARSIKVPGFRKGKVPSHVAEQQVDRAAIVERALELILPAHLTAALKEKNIKPITQPDIKPLSLEWEKDWQLEVQIGEEPQITLGDYKKSVKAALKKAETEIATNAQEAAAHAKEHQEAETKNEKIDHQHAHVHELSDEQKKDVSLKHVFQGLVADVKPAIPELVLREQTRHELRHLVQTLQYSKLALDDYLQRRQQSFEQLSNELAAFSLGQLQLEYILKAIVEAEKLAPSEAEVTKFLSDLNKDKKDDSTPQAKSAQLKNQVTQHLTRQKVTEYLLNL